MSNHPSPVLRAAIGVLCSSFGLHTTAQTLVRDFNTTPTAGWSSHPQSFQTLPNGNLLFLTYSPVNGSALWTTDGTTSGTVLAVQGPAGAGMGPLAALGNGTFVFVVETTGLGAELWRTDGTMNGTALIADLRPGSGSSNPQYLTRVGNQIVFTADDGVHGTELWATDGTTAGTRMIRDVVPGLASSSPHSITAIGPNRFVFQPQTVVGSVLWASDFTAAGTQSIAVLDSIAGLSSFGARALFAGRIANSPTQAWITDGTAAGTVSLGVEVASPGGFQVAGNRAYFPGTTASTGYELWVTDGSLAGTSLVVELWPGGGHYGGSWPLLVGSVQNDALFFANAPSGGGLFRSNGTAAGTTRISTFALVGFSYGISNYGTAVNGVVYYRLLGEGTQSRLYRTDGTAAGTGLVANFSTGAIGGIGSTVLFAGDDGSGIGTELWRSSGTAASPQLVLDIAPGQGTAASNPVLVGTFRDRALVLAPTATNGRELWTTDGTPAGTQLLADLEPGPGNSYPSLAANDRRMVIFQAPGANDGDPWFSDGTPAGTAQLDILPPNSGFSGARPAAFGDRFVFAGNMPGTGVEPWITDGTVAGTSLLLDVAPGTGSSSPQTWLQLGNVMLFQTTGPNGYELWATDGTSAGTQRLADLDPWSAMTAFDPIVIGAHAYYATVSPTAGAELFRTDGTPAGTGLFADLEPGSASSSPSRLTALGNTLLMRATVGGQTRPVAVDTTTAAVTVLNQGLDLIGPYSIDATTAVFFAPSPLGPSTFWRTDGTDAGTVPLRAFGQVRHYPTPKRSGVDRLVFVARDGAADFELWSTDATATGTLPITAFGSEPGLQDLERAGEWLVFPADDGVHGTELMALSMAQTMDWVFAPYGTGCPGTGGITPALGRTGVARVTAAAPFALTLSAAQPNTLALLAIGLQRGAAPIPGCTLWLDGPIALLTTPTDALGGAAVPLALPPALLGARFTGQFFALDAAGPALGLLSSTGAVEVVIGS